MIELVITGGLGNQMFQYAFARCLQLKTKDSLVINTNLYNIDNHGRRFALGYFNLPSREVSVVDKPAIFVKWLSGNSFLNERFLFNFLKMFGIYAWKSYRYKKIECCKKRNIIFGYYQSEKFFKDYAAIIKRELKICKPINAFSESWLKKIKTTASVCVHIRRTDYIAENMVVCDNEYYHKAIDYMKKALHNPVFYFFSDDMEWVRNNFKDPLYRYVDSGMDYEDLCLMYNCKHFIMSNSTFCWWAQYLCEYNQKIVIAPPKWMPDNPVRDIYLDSWTILE